MNQKARKKHADYMREYRRRNGKVGANPGRPANTPDVLWSKVQVGAADECWPWIGSVNGGYGRTQIDGKNYYAHRVIFDLAHPGMINRASPENRRGPGLLLHHCGDRLCCNPSHLYIGTQKDNMQDRLKTGDGYRNLPRGEKHHAAVLSDEDRALLLEMSDQGVRGCDLAEIFRLNRSTVKSMVYWHKRGVSDERQ